MSKNLQSDDGKHIVIRPMAYLKEADSTRYAKVKQFRSSRAICTARRRTCTADQRANARVGEKYPGRVESIFSPLSTIVPSHLMDPNMFGFKDLKADDEANPLGDIAFDDDSCSTPAPAPGAFSI
jgi:tRNA 2-thiocytidine biosynthesis protein TtcA